MRNNRGFTIIETLLAVLIIAGSFLVLSNTWNGSLLAIRKSRHLNTVSHLLIKKMTEIEIKYKDKPSEVPEEEAGDFGKEFDGYRWTLKSRKLELPDLTVPLTGKDGGANEMQLMLIKKLQTMIEESIREVQVTVLYKGPKKDVGYSVASYMIDYKGGAAAAATLPTSDTDAAGEGGGK